MVALQSLQLELHRFQMLVLDVLKMLSAVLMDPVVIGLKNLENVFLSVPFLQIQQQHHP
jgi:hypothetical protein